MVETEKRHLKTGPHFHVDTTAWHGRRGREAFATASAFTAADQNRCPHKLNNLLVWTRESIPAKFIKRHEFIHFSTREIYLHIVQI